MLPIFLTLSLIAGSFLYGQGTGGVPDRWLGAWKLNVSETKIGNRSLPRSLILRFESAPGGMKVISDAVNVRGEVHSEYTVTYDGKDIAPNANMPAATIAAKRIDANTFDFFSKLNSAVVATTRHVVSPDGKKLIATAKGTRAVRDLNGRATNQEFSDVIVYDKQP